MSEPKDSTSFFRKVVKFVANPTTEWSEVGAPTRRGHAPCEYGRSGGGSRGDGGTSTVGASTGAGASWRYA